MKAKEKANLVSNKPNPFRHMMAWGFGSGTILAQLYMVFIFKEFFDLQRLGLLETIGVLLNPFGWVFALIVGGIPGHLIGFLDGYILYLVLMGTSKPFTKEDAQAIRYKVYGAIGIPTMLFGFAIINFFLGMGRLSVFPPLIAGIAAAYAAHRYLFRLRLWSEAVYGIQKEKAKNIEHLEDKPKTDILSLEAEEESSISGLS